MTAAGPNLETAEGRLTTPDGRHWLYHVANLDRTPAGLRHLILAAPEDELLGNARKVRDETLIVSGLILLAWLPVAWLASRFVSRPLLKLNEEAAAIRNLDFSERPHTESIIIEIERLSDTFDTMRSRVRQYNEAAMRFVPYPFLERLHRSNIIEIGLGDHVEQEMTVLFSDIRSFTTLSEGMSPQETFDFINAYLGRVGPIVRNHGGFIDKYVGDAVMALFPPGGSPLDAALAIQREVEAFNAAQPPGIRDPIAAGIGLHDGPLMLGTVGEEQRFETTVIADAVNVASRLEGLTKTFGVKILISGAVLATLDAGAYHVRRGLGVDVRGASARPGRWRSTKFATPTRPTCSLTKSGLLCSSPRRAARTRVVPSLRQSYFSARSSQPIPEICRQPTFRRGARRWPPPRVWSGTASSASRPSRRRAHAKKTHYPDDCRSHAGHHRDSALNWWSCRGTAPRVRKAGHVLSPGSVSSLS